MPLHILNLLVTSSDDPSPFDLLNDIKNHVDTDNSLDHKYLKLEAEQCNFEPGMTLDSYVTSHTKIASRTIAAHYPDIKNPTNTVEFLINGLRLNPETALIGLQLHALAPADIKDFTHKFNRMKAYNTPETGSAISLHPSVLHMPFKSHRRPLQPSLYRTSRHQNTARPTEFKPCSHHIRIGVLHPQHPDEECRAPDHSRHMNRGRSTRYAPLRSSPPPRARLVQTIPNDIAPSHYQEMDNAISQEDSTPLEIPTFSDELEIMTGWFILDSGAHPSHTPRPTATTPPLRRAVQTRTATNHTSTCTHCGTIQIHTNLGQPLRLAAVVNPSIQDTLISVQFFIRSTGNVTFTKECACIYNRCGTCVGTAP